MPVLLKVSIRQACFAVSLQGPALPQEALRVVLGGFDGYVFDQLAFAGLTWDVDPRDAEAPALLWYGEADEGCPPTYGRWYAERIAGSHLTVFPGEGHLDVCDGHWPEVLAGLLRVWR